MKNKLYNEYADEYSERIKKNVYNAMFDRPNIIALLPDVEDKNVLDLGCGPGEYSKFLINNKAEVTAVDISEKFINSIKKQFPNIISYLQDLNQGLPKETSEHFDLVVSGLTIHYIENIKFMFGEVARVLKEGGEFIFSTHSPIADAINYHTENYYSTELITDIWNTIGIPVEVKFYRRPMSSIFNALLNSGFVITGFSEGLVTNDIKEVSERNYINLTSKPSFMFIRAKKCDQTRCIKESNNSFFTLG